MRGSTLLIPFILIRFLLLFILSREGLKRAAYFAPIIGKERVAYVIYQLSTIGILIYIIFLTYQIGESLYYFLAVAVYMAGILLLLPSTIHFALPSLKGLNTKGVYRWTRHPMYLSYFIYFIGCTLLTRSYILFCIVLIFQLSAHWIILSEERWCIEQFGEEYVQYMKQVRRYL